MSPSREALVEQLRQALEPRPEILEAYLFGSAARDQRTPLSDVDVAVFVGAEPPTTWGYDATLTADLMSRLHTNRIDVVVLNHAPPMLYHRVLRDGVRLFARDLGATTGREGYALSRYFDFAIQLAKVDTAHSARLRRGDFGR